MWNHFKRVLWLHAWLLPRGGYPLLAGRANKCSFHFLKLTAAFHSHTLLQLQRIIHEMHHIHQQLKHMHHVMLRPTTSALLSYCLHEYCALTDCTTGTINVKRVGSIQPSCSSTWRRWICRLTCSTFNPNSFSLSPPGGLHGRRVWFAALPQPWHSRPVLSALAVSLSSRWVTELFIWSHITYHKASLFNAQEGSTTAS